jgi:glycosyltransferase involved in cell wall biosynthesis
MTISVVIPAYNSEAHIERAIDSVLGQSVAADEIIVIDDGSTDGTADVVAGFGDKVKYIRQENAGAGAARNTGIEAATSEWIAFLDSDDEWEAEKNRLQTELIDRNPDISWAYSNCYLYLASQASRKNLLNQEKAEKLLEGADCFDNYLNIHAKGFPAWTGTVIAKKEAIIKVGMFNPNLPLAQDIDLWFRIAYQFPKVGFIAASLAVYNFETPQSNTKRFTDTSHICNIIDRHLKLSADRNCLAEFQRCIFPIVHYWVLILSKQQRYHDMRSLINKYRRYLPARYYLRKSIRGLFPGPVRCYNKVVAKLKNRS